MGQEVIRFIQVMNQSEIETQMALQCAPVLAGVKVSNLLIINQKDKLTAMKLLLETSLSFFLLSNDREKTTLLIYRKEMLSRLLQQKDIAEVMRQFGYFGLNFFGILQRMSKKYIQYQKNREDFPHELGILLGYPLCDVLGFMEHGGKNSLYTGYWKVYGDVHKSMQEFERFDQAKRTVMQMLVKGKGIPDIVSLLESEEKMLAV